MSETRDLAGPYLFGSSAAETQRLIELDGLLRPSTRQVLLNAGITEGMRVLDVGCGPGSVSLLAAELVGPAGWVIGVDRSQAVLNAARERARAWELRNVAFVQADLGGLGTEGWLEPGFDAVVGRLILLHLADPLALLRELAPYLRPDGVVAFQEPDLTRMGASVPPLPVLEQLCDWVRHAHRRFGIDCQFGLLLPQLFEDAGLPSPQLRCDAFIGSGPGWGWYDQMLHAAQNALPVVLARGIATAEQADMESLAEQLREAVASQRSVTRAIDLVSAWTRTASAQG
jgi:ubiquinone/menaquinone biosynthesis C-methylase UbiE